jgi:hypothetical protein
MNGAKRNAPAPEDASRSPSSCARVNGNKKGRPYRGYKLSPIFDILERKIPDFEQILYQSRGLELMADESLRMSLFLENMVSFGIKVFPVHDAVMGKVSDKDIILEYLIECFTVNDIEPIVEVEEPI